MSPWDVFSMLHALRYDSSFLIGTGILIIILIGMCFHDRFFCRCLCPMGAVFSILPVLPWFSLHKKRSNCIKGCSGCTKKCPSNIALSDEKEIQVDGDCFMCQKCIDTCQKENIQTGIHGLKGNEIYLYIT